MGIDLSGIVKNDFRDRRHKKACEEYVNSTINRLTKLYHVDKGTFELEYDDYDGFYDFSIHTELWDIMRLQLCVGMWHVEVAVHYCQTFFRNQYWRMMLEEIADALGQKELWICDENCTWNSSYLPHDIAETSFEEWYSCIASSIEGYENGVIPDYPTEAVLKVPQGEFYPALKAYHDTTDMYLNKKLSESKNLSGGKLLGLTGVGEVFYPTEKNGKLYLISQDSKKIVSDGPIDSYEECLNHAGFVIIKNGYRQLVDMYGNIMSEPIKGRFNWKWDNKMDWPQDIIIFNDSLPTRWRVNLKTGEMTEIDKNFKID